MIVNAKQVDFSINNPYIDKKNGEGNDLRRDNAKRRHVKLENKDVNNSEYYSDDEKYDCEENRRYEMFLNRFRFCHNKFLTVGDRGYQIKIRCISIDGIWSVLIQAYTNKKRKDTELAGSELLFHLTFAYGMKRKIRV